MQKRAAVPIRKGEKVVFVVDRFFPWLMREGESMTNVKRKGLVYALILTLCLGVIPFNVASFQAAAETKSKAPAVTAKTYSKKAGRYTVKVKQAKVDYKTVNVYVPDVKTLKKVKGKKKVYKIKATAYMYCDKKVSKKKSKTVKLSSIRKLQ